MKRWKIFSFVSQQWSQLHQRLKSFPLFWCCSSCNQTTLLVSCADYFAPVIAAFNKRSPSWNFYNCCSSCKRRTNGKKDKNVYSAKVHLSFALTLLQPWPFVGSFDVEHWWIIRRNINSAFACNLQSSDLSQMFAVLATKGQNEGRLHTTLSLFLVELCPLSLLSLLRHQKSLLLSLPANFRDASRQFVESFRKFRGNVYWRLGRLKNRHSHWRLFCANVGSNFNYRAKAYEN